MSRHHDYLSYYDPGEWFQFPKGFLRFLKPDAAVFLAYLINAYRARKVDSEHWIRVPDRMLADHLCSNKQKVERQLKVLERKGIIESRVVRAMPPFREVRVRGKELDRLVRSTAAAQTTGIESDTCSVSNSIPAWYQKGHHKREEETTKNHQISPRQAGGIRVVVRISTKKSRAHCEYCAGTDWEEMAKRLGKAWRKVRSGHDPEFGIRSSAQGFKTAHVRGAPMGRLSEVLRWYCRMLLDDGDINVRNPNFWPVTLSGSSWPDKWQRLDAAMEKYYSLHGRPDGEVQTSAKTGKPLFGVEIVGEITPDQMRKRLGW